MNFVSRVCRQHLVVLLLYVGLAIAATWPLASRATSQIVVGTEIARTVPFFNAWTVWWNAETLTSGSPWYVGEQYWNAPIFFPANNAFAFSEPQPLTIVVAPIVMWTGSLPLAMNVYLWLSLVLNAMFARRACEVMGMRPLSSACGGIAMLLLPIVHWQIGVAQLVPVWGVIWSWLVLIKIRTAHLDIAAFKTLNRLGIELGLSLVFTWWACVHHGLMAGFLIMFGLLTFGSLLVRARFWLIMAVAGVVFITLMFPTIYHLGRMTMDYKFTRTDEVINLLSLQPRDYLQTHGHTLLQAPKSWLESGWVRPGWPTSPGAVKLGLMLVGIALGCRRGHRPVTSLISLMMLVSLLLAFGSNLQILGWQPWETLKEWVPGFQQIRSVYRFEYFFQIGAVLMATRAIDLLWAVPVDARWKRWCYRSVIILLGLAATFDPWPPVLRLGVFPDSPGLTQMTNPAGWMEVLGDSEAAGGQGILCLPMAGGDNVRDYEIATEWMLLGRYHGRPMVNGYSGFFPPAYFDIRDQILKNGLSPEVMRELAVRNVGWLVVDRRRVTLDPAVISAPGIGLVRVFSDQGPIELYRIIPKT